MASLLSCLGKATVCLGKVTLCHGCLQCCISGVGKKVLDDDDRDFHSETKQILEEEMGKDNFTLVMPLFGPKDFVEHVPPESDDIKTSNLDYGWKRTDDGWKKKNIRLFSEKVSNQFTISVPDEDDILNDKYTIIERITHEALTSKFFFPMNDLDYICKDREVVTRIMKELLLCEGQAMPNTYNTDFNMETDESFARIFFLGIGCVLLEKQEKVSEGEYGPFVVDMPIQELEYRSLYRPLGARCHFSKDQKPKAIFDYHQGKLFLPGEEGWENAKLLAKVTAFTVATAQEHLIWTHFLVSNNASREITTKLNPEHPLRRLLAVFTFNANVVNAEAYKMLVPKYSFLHRSSGFTIDALYSVFDSAFKTSTIFKPFTEKTYNPALQELINDGKFPYATQFSEYYEIVRTFVKSWLKKAGEAAADKEAKGFYNAMKATTKGQAYELPEFSEDALVNLCSTIIFTVTAYHELIGHVVDYTVFPWRSGFRLTKKDPSMIDLQSLLLSGLISASTSKRMPMLMSPFKNFFGAEGAPAWERDLWDSFLEELHKQSKKVKAEDAAADYEWKYGDPAIYESSVSV